jgi:hypothetical protein
VRHGIRRHPVRHGAGFNPFLAHCLRFDQRTILVCQLYGVANTVFVHAGIQIVPTWWDQSWVSKWYVCPRGDPARHGLPTAHGLWQRARRADVMAPQPPRRGGRMRSTALHPTPRGIPHGTVSHAGTARFPARHGYQHGTVSRPAWHTARR